ncbi:hypothetical protein BDN70DRAFT_928263 [Pholiota conissans]|uniref:F-box domain-containing protein n=1 Tax=Pholiota conissans TaxID=109636 RepID=A0A9P6CYY4_9AGAR|nr:hypothetical protein BDN70DRAFT_928263 [Pholiota conissans]
MARFADASRFDTSTLTMTSQPSSSPSPSEFNAIEVTSPIGGLGIGASFVLPSNGDKTEQISRIDAECAALNRRRNALLPAVNLPPEVLSLIFEFVCSPLDSEGRFSTNIDRPLFIIRVCSVWRNVGLSTTQLWNSIKLGVNRTVDAEKRATLLQYWLSKTGQRRLTEPSTAVYDVLASYAPRLQTAELWMTERLRPALSRIGESASSLTCLTLNGYESEDFESVEFFSTAPRLSDVTLIGYNIQNVILPYVQLEYLSTTDINVHDPLEALRLCPNLQHCTLRAESTGFLPDMASAAGPLTHSLQSLELLLESEVELAWILDKLSLPELSSLNISLVSGAPAASLMAPFFVRSLCTFDLTSLYLGSNTLPEDEIAACLLVLPGLEKLSLQYLVGGEISYFLLDMMNPKRFPVLIRHHNREHTAHADWIFDVPCLVPNLREFSLSYSKVTVDSHALVECLAGRWHEWWHGEVPEGEQMSSKFITPLARLRTVILPSRQVNFGDEDMVIVDRLRLEGMKIQMKSI